MPTREATERKFDTCDACGQLNEAHNPTYCPKDNHLLDPSSPVGLIARLSALPSPEGQRADILCPQCGNYRSNPREDSIERLLVCGDSFHDTPSKHELLPNTPQEERIRELAKMLFGIAYRYDPGKNSERLRGIYAESAALFGITKEQMLELRDDIQPPAAPQVTSKEEQER